MEERVIESAIYIIEHNATVRQTAKQFGVSKSTVHKDVTERLETINKTLARQARKVLDINKSERHIRGGLATKENIFIDRIKGNYEMPGYMQIVRRYTSTGMEKSHHTRLDFF